MGLLAAPSYLAQAPIITTPQDLHLHRWLVADPLRTLNLTRSDTGETYSQPLMGPGARSLVNDVVLAAELACAGLGLLYGPLWACEQPLQSGALVQVLPQWQARANDISLVWPQQRQLPARVRALIDMLVEFSASNPTLQSQMPIIAHHE